MSQPSRTPDLPPETIDRILSYLADDPTPLRASALVSRLWLALARRYLFRKVYISDPIHITGFCSILEHSPIIYDYLQEVCLSYDCRTFFPLLGRFVHLKWITFEQTSWGWSVDDLHLLIMLSAARTVTSLTFKWSSISVPEICAVLCAFPALECVELEDTMSRGLGNEEHAPVQSLFLHDLSLKSLRIHSVTFLKHPFGEATAFVPWLLGTNTRLTLRKLDIAVGVWSVPVIGILFCATAPRLEHLEISFRHSLGTVKNPGFSERIRQQLTLQDMPNLQTLLIRFGYGSFHLVSAVLSSITSPHIHTITLQPRTQLPDMVDHPDHADIDRLFQETRGILRECGPLKRVVFAYEGELDEEVMRQRVAGVYHGLQRRGILHVKWVIARDLY